MKRLFMTGLVAMAVIAGPGWSEDTGEIGSAADGQTIYERYCATCHGLDGTGQGPMQAVLTVLPTDLTQLTAGNDGRFPLERVVKRIDGRDPLVAHGSPMPVYGDFFDTGAGVAMKTEAGQPVMTSQPVADLVAYLRDLQAE